MTLWPLTLIRDGIPYRAAESVVAQIEEKTVTKAGSERGLEESVYGMRQSPWPLC